MSLSFSLPATAKGNVLGRLQGLVSFSYGLGPRHGRRSCNKHCSCHVFQNPVSCAPGHPMGGGVSWSAPRKLPAPVGGQEPCWWAVLCLSLVVWHKETEAECPQSNYSLCSSWLLRMRVLLRVEVLSSPQNTSLTFL